MELRLMNRRQALNWNESAAPGKQERRSRRFHVTNGLEFNNHRRNTSRSGMKSALR
jgi:hypothetical protein